MGLLAWTASVRAQCLTDNVMLDLQIVNGTSTDYSDFSNSVTLQGSPTYVTGQNGHQNGALHFANQTPYQYASIPPNAAFQQMNDAFTIAAWVYPTSLSSYNTIIGKVNGSHRNIVLRYHADGRVQLHYTASPATVYVTTDDPEVTATNQWYHLAATFDGNSVKIFVNGVLKKEQAVASSPTFQLSGNLLIGSLNAGTERVIGYVDDVQMRSFAMEDESVPCLMSHGLNVNSGLVLSLPLDGDGTDVTGYGNDGSINGATASAAIDRFGNAGSCMNFSGSGYVQVSSTGQSQYGNLASGFSISAWVNPTSVSGNHVIVSKVNNGRDIVLRIDNGKFTVHYYFGGYIWFVPASATISANEWTNVACTWDGTTMKLYQDGVEIHSNEPTIGPNITNNADWRIGALASSGGENFGGKIDDVKVWGRALVPCELDKNLYPALNLVVDDNLILCPGQNAIVETLGSLCSVLWTNDNSTEFFFDIDADDLGVGDHQIVLEAYDNYDNFYSDTVNVTVSLCTGIEESETMSEIRVYPNPASAIVTVEVDDMQQVQLLDVSGRLLETQNAQNLNRLDLNISVVPAGVYFLRVTVNDGSVVSKRLVKH